MEPCRWRVQFRGLPKAGIVPDIWQLSPISYVLSSLSELLIGHATSLSGITLAVSVTLTLAVSVTLPATISRMTFSHACSTSNRQIGHFINRGTLFQNYQGNCQSPAQIVYQNVNADQEDPNGAIRQNSS